MVNQEKVRRQLRRMRTNVGEDQWSDAQPRGMVTPEKKAKVGKKGGKPRDHANEVEVMPSPATEGESAVGGKKTKEVRSSRRVQRSTKRRLKRCSVELLV